MKPTTDLTTAELLNLHNALCPPDAKLTQWKKSKDKLVAIIEDLQPIPNAKTISQTIMAMLMDAELNYAEIVSAVREQFPDARTTARSVASMACVARRNGIAVPKRK